MPSNVRCAPRSRLWTALVVGAVLPACATTRTTASVRALPEPSTEQLRLVRTDAAALLGTWTQRDHALLGRISFTEACQAETVANVRRIRVTETRPNSTYATAAILTGAALSVLGTGLLATSRSKDERVFCGDGVGAPKSGETCHSEAGAWRQLGMATLGVGIGTILGGVIVQSRKPTVETLELPPARHVSVAAGAKPCGNPAALTGLVVAAELLEGGRWLGRVEGDGSVRIDLSESLLLRDGAPVRMSVESVPAGAPTLIKPGMLVGELKLRKVAMIAERARGGLRR